MKLVDVLRWADGIGNGSELMCQQYSFCPQRAFTIHGVLWLDSKVGPSEVATHFLEKLWQFPAFHTEIRQESEGWGSFRHRYVDARSVWTDKLHELIKEVHLFEEVERESLPDDWASAAVERFVTDILTMPFGEGRPSWQCFLLQLPALHTASTHAPPARAAGGKALSVIVLRIHHALVDGQLLLQAAINALQSDIPKSDACEADVSGRLRHRPVQAADQSASMLSTTTAGRRTACSHHTAGSQPPGAKLAVHPQHYYTAWTAWPAWLVYFAWIIWTQLRCIAWDFFAEGIAPLMSPNSTTALTPHGKHCGRPVARYLQPVALDDLKRAARRNGATVTDVMMTVMAGAARRYLMECDTEFAVGRDVNLRVSVAKNLRTFPPQSEGKFGTFTNFYRPKLAVQSVDVGSRLLKMKAYGAKGREKCLLWILKLSFSSVTFCCGIVRPLWAMLGRGFFGVSKDAYGRFRDCLALTSVPGPEKILYLGKHAVTQVQGFVNYPQIVTAVGYNGLLHPTVVLDDGIMKVDDLVRCLNEEMVTVMSYLKEK